MNYKIVLLRKERDELMDKFIKERDKLYESVYAEEIDTLNKKINELQKKDIDEWRKKAGLDV